MSDVMLLGVLRMPIDAGEPLSPLAQFVSRAREAADRIEADAAEIERLRSALLDIADAARLSPYREAGAWDDSLAKLIARRVKFLRP